jgi:ornithine cyclodeaminase
MPNIKIITEAELRRLVPMDLAAVDCVEQGFRTLAEGKVVMPPIMSMPVREHNGEICVKAAYVPGLDSFAVKMSPGFFDNPKLGLPSSSGMMVLFSSRTGMLEAILLDNGYLTDVRTAAAGAVAARHLARENASTACVIGAGMQARLQLQALMLVRPISSAVIWARDPDKAKAVAAQLTKDLGISVTSNSNAEAAVTSADVVITTTPASAPLVMADWLRPGQLIIAVGSDQDHKCELEPACIVRADLYIPDSQVQTEERGELRSAISAGLVSAEQNFTELGEIAAGVTLGRQSAEVIIVADLTGAGVQDTAIATYAFAKSAEKGLGSDFTN